MAVIYRNPGVDPPVLAVSAGALPTVLDARMHQRKLWSLLVAAGAISGVALASLTPRQWSRLGALLFGGAAWLLRSPLGPALLAAALARGSQPAGRAPAPELDPLSLRRLDHAP